MADNLNELFSYPVRLRKAVILGDVTLYSSDGLLRSFKKSIRKSPRMKSISNEVEKLIDNETIIPCYFEKGILKFVMWKIFAPKGATSLTAFYDFEIKKIIVLLSNKLNIFGYVSNDKLSMIIIHELIHLLGNSNPSSFLGIFLEKLVSYYSFVLTEIFSLKDVDPKEVRKFVTFLFKEVEQSKNPIKKKISSLPLHLKKFKIYSTNPSKFDKLTSDYIEVVYLLYTNISKLISNQREYIPILRPLYYGHKKVFGFIPSNTFCVQELIYPTEVIAVSTQFETTPEIVSFIKSSVS